jgi:hypothetical protein
MAQPRAPKMNALPQNGSDTVSKVSHQIRRLHKLKHEFLEA